MPASRVPPASLPPASLPPAPGAAARAPGPSGLALCTGGAALRALCAVHACAAVGGGFVAADVGAWAQGLAVASAVATPATLLWLAAGCAAGRWLARPGAPAWGERAVVALAGALAAGAGGLAFGVVALLRPDAPAPLGGVASVLAGAALGAGFAHWLQLRQRGRLPADAAARVVELQERIRPHFLFNTLNTAIALVRLDPQRAEQVLEDLAELFRAALRAGPAQATLGSEIEIAQRYLDIERIRFGERLRVDWQLDPDAAAAPVPALLLQPLVENAVRHGVEPAGEGGEIRIRTRVRGPWVELRVSNTLVEGAPVTPGHGVGLASVRQRLALMHDLNAHLSAGPDGPGRFRVEVRVPRGAA